MNRKSFFKFLAIFSFVGLCIFAFGPDLKAFTDVDSTTKNVDAIMDLYNRGIINGYDDGSFKPDNSITRGEVAIMISKAFDYDDTTALTNFLDVPADAWLHPYVMRVANARVMGSVGYDNFGPMQNITYDEILKIAVSIFGKDKLAEAVGGWPEGYSAVANALMIADSNVTTFYNASRADLCLVISKVLKSQNNPECLIVDSKNIELGMTTDQLDMPSKVLPSNYEGVDWYLYNTDTYDNFYGLMVKSDVVIGFAAIGDGFTYKDKRAGDYYEMESNTFFAHKFFYTDKNDGNRIHGVYEKYLLRGIDKQYNNLSGVEKANFHFVNAFRVYNNREPLIWDDTIAEIAREHSKDMADRNYYSHDTPEGEDFSDRFKRRGLSGAGGENIYCGTNLDAFQAYDGWVNSKGHRNIMLGGNYNYLGVGAAYNKNSEWGLYFTQNYAYKR